jgi:hypothetical protein
MRTIIIEVAAPFLGMDASKALGFLDTNLKPLSVEDYGFWLFLFQYAVPGLRQRVAYGLPARPIPQSFELSLDARLGRDLTN